MTEKNKKLIFLLTFQKTFFYNLDCMSFFRPGAPVPIEYLPEENRLESRVNLQIMYNGKPTKTIAVGDPLTFKLQAQGGYGLIPDIFAYNVIAKDPYSGRAVQLIDFRG